MDALQGWRAKTEAMAHGEFDEIADYEENATLIMSESTVDALQKAKERLSPPPTHTAAPPGGVVSGQKGQPMDALQKAKDAIEGIDLGDQSLGEAEFTAIYAQACAAIATAEAAQRQAAALERIADALYVEGINKEPRSVAAILSSMEWAQA